jgi:hypothetical protein
MYMTFTQHELDGLRIYKVMHAWFDACRLQLCRATVCLARQTRRTYIYRRHQ